MYSVPSELLAFVNGSIDNLAGFLVTHYDLSTRQADRVIADWLITQARERGSAVISTAYLNEAVHILLKTDLDVEFKAGFKKYIEAILEMAPKSDGTANRITTEQSNTGSSESTAASLEGETKGDQSNNE